MWFNILLSTSERKIEVDIQDRFGLDQILPACIMHTLAHRAMINEGKEKPAFASFMEWTMEE